MESDAPPRELTQAEELELYRRLCEEFTTFIENSYDGIYITDGVGRARIVNEAYFRITGLSRADVFGKSLDELIASGLIKDSVARKILGSKQATTILQEIRGRQVIITGTPVLDEAGGIRFIVINIRDITELNTLKNQLKSTRRLTDRYFSELSELRIQQLRMEELVVGSAMMEEVLQKALRVARVDSTVILEGESGVGKSVFAKPIHKASRRADKSYINVNCGTIPAAQPGFSVLLLKALRDAGIHSAIETSGCAPAEHFDAVARAADLVLFDLKHTDPAVHEEQTGVPNGGIVDNLKRLVGTRKPVVLRIPVVPGVNDAIGELVRLANFAKGLGDAVERIDLLPYHRYGDPKYARLGMASRCNGAEPPPPERMEEIAGLFRAYDLKARVGG